MAKVTFSSLSVALSVCLSVCLLAALRENGWTDFHDFFRVGGTIQGTIVNIFRMFHFQKRTDLTQGAIWNTFGMLRLTHWILGGLIYFLDPCLFVIYGKTGEWIFMKFLWKVRHNTRNILAWLFHTCLDGFMVLHLGDPNVFVSNTTVKSMSGFSLNFQDILAMTQGLIWNILGIIGLTPWTQGSFFYFLIPCWLATSRNTGWMDIHEIFRIWTQEAISYTVSRLSRLFHALQTRRGGGLRSRSAFCLK